MSTSHDVVSAGNGFYIEGAGCTSPVARVHLDIDGTVKETTPDETGAWKTFYTTNENATGDVVVSATCDTHEGTFVYESVRVQIDGEDLGVVVPWVPAASGEATVEAEDGVPAASTLEATLEPTDAGSTQQPKPSQPSKKPGLPSAGV